MVLDLILFHLNIWRTNGQNFTKFCIYAWQSTMGVLPVILLLICNRVMALDWCQNFVPAKYL